MAKFQNLNVSYKQLRSFSVSDRVSMMSMPSFSNVLSSLTPEQFASLFPKYYYRNVANPSSFLSALTPDTRKYVERSGFNSAVTTKPPIQQKSSTPAWQARIQAATGINLSDPSAKARVTEEQSALWKDLKEKNTIAADSPNVAILNKLSADDLAKVGIEKVQADGKDVFKLTPTKASQVSDSEIESGFRSSSSAGISPREKAVSDFIARREGATDPNTVFGGPKFARQLGLDKVPLTERSIADVIKLQGELRELVKAAAARGELPNINAEAQRVGTSAVGRGQFVEGTLKSLLRDVGIPEKDWSKIKFDEKLQEKLTLQNFRKNVGDPNGDPSQWNMNGLTRQWEAFAKRGPTSAEIQQIASQSNQKPAIGPITPQMIADERARRIAAEEEERRQYLAGTQLAPPAGLSPQIVSEYKKLNPGQKQLFNDAIERGGAEAIRKFNENFDRQNLKLADIVNVKFSNDKIKQDVELLSTDMKTSLRKLEAFAPPDTVITSTFRGANHPIEARKARPGAHSRGSAVDIRTNGRTPEQLQETVKSLKRAGFTKILLEGDHIHAEVNPGQEFHVTNLGSGNPIISLAAAREAAQTVGFNEEVPSQQADIRTAAERVAPKQTTPTVVPAPEGSPGASSNTNSTNIQTQSAPTVVSAPPGSPGNSVPTNAYGGEVETDAKQITALPIGGLKGDNSVVVDENAKPIFTMNANETVTMKDGRASIEPTQKTDPDALETRDVPKEASARQATETAKEARDVVMVQQPTISSGITAVPLLSENPIQTASFARAMAANRMQKTTDALGGHFDLGASNLK